MSLQTDRLEPEDGMILALLAGDELDGMLAPLKAGEERRRREYVELLGLLPFGLEPMAPRPEVKERVLAAIGQDGAHAPQAAPVPPPPVRRRWPVALAASLLLALLASTLFFYTQWQGSRTQLATMQAEMQQQLATVQNEMSQVSDRFALVTRSGTEICPLRPVAGSPQPVARGTLYVMPGGNGWYLRLRSLEPVPRGQEYQVWFATPGGPVSGGTFEVEGGAPEVELTSEQMPKGVEAVFLTIEPEGGTVAPTGPRVLYGAEKMQVL